MTEFSVAIVAAENDQRDILRLLVEGTSIARVRAAFESFPVGTSDLVLRRMQDLRVDVVLLDIPPQDAAAALRAVELVRAELPSAAIFAVGDMAQPQVIVSAMRAGAREYLDRATNPAQLLEAFVRLTSSQRAHTSGHRGKVFTFVNAKGGCGATTLAVNTALAMQSLHRGAALVDLAPLGHAALHLNLSPSFTVLDAIRNVHRLDGSLLESYMTRHENGLHLLAGNKEPVELTSSAGDFARLFDLLVSQYRFVVVDASSRLDHASRVLAELSEAVLLVAQSDVASLWSAARVQQFLADGISRERVRLVLNRFRKIAGFSESDAERAAHSRLLWKIPNQYSAVAASIDRGVPVGQQNHSEIARSFIGLAGALTQPGETTRGRSRSLFQPA